MIQPTVGRVVWFTPQTGAGGAFQRDVEQPLAAQIAYVHGDTLINIGFLDQDGVHHSATSVPLLQEGDDKPEQGRFCTWMPYQLGQAARTERQRPTTGARASNTRAMTNEPGSN